jgi:hypothetical protein
MGMTTVTVTAPNFGSATVQAMFTNTAQILVLSGDTNLGKGLELPYTLSLPNNAGSGGQAVTIMSNSSSVLLSATAAGAGSTTLNLTIPANTSSIVFYVQGASSAGSGTITASATTGFTSANATLTLHPSGVIITPSVSGSPNTSGADQLFFVWLDSSNTPQFENAFMVASNSIAIGVSSGNSTVASVPSTITITPGNGPGGVPINFGSAGSTTISITQPAGFGLPNEYTNSAVIVQ